MTKRNIVLSLLVLLLIFAVVFLYDAAQTKGTETLTLATTTSTYDSGLLDYILPPFEETNRVKVKVLAVGTGEALELGRRGDADVVLVHARSREDQFVAQGYGINRKDVMYNDFILLGPEADPAGIRGMEDAATAFARIAQTQSVFVSRGDNSGTHIKELSLWDNAGITPGAVDWYKSVGQGMGETLTMADEMEAYTLSDRATYLSRRSSLSLIILVEGDPALFNPYGVIAVNPAKNPQVKYTLAMKLIDYLTSIETQESIAQFKKYGEVLFYPDSEEWRAKQ